MTHFLEHHLYMLVAKHLRENPTTPETAVLVRVPGAPLPDPNKPYPTPAVPKGWKVGTILPYYSPALTGGGVSENFFKDMMAEMQGQIPGAIPPATATGGEVRKKKDKKKK
jgi:signal recognition particle subunit SRP19